MVSYLAHYNTLLQNTIDIITKSDKSLKRVKFLLQLSVLLQNARVITKCESY